MARRKRHTAAEIAAKLEEATNLEASGRSQKDIARQLGVSIMTFHRWRKMNPRSEGAQSAATANTFALGTRSSGRQEGLNELRLENSRLRKLVTDLLLEKIKIEDDAALLHGRVKKARAA